MLFRYAILVSLRSKSADEACFDPHRPVDFVPLVKALHHLGEKRFGNRVLRSTLGSALKLSPSCPIGSATYPDFRRYVEAAHRAGFVEFGVNKARDAWVRSTGKLERACAGKQGACRVTSEVVHHDPLEAPKNIYRYIRAWTERAPSKSLRKRSVHARTSLYTES